MNILTFDIEEWFHILDFEATRCEEQWNHYEVRIYNNVDRILRILEETETKATFFVVGWIASRYPDIVKKISEKYEIGTHTSSHQLVWQQSPVEFRKDVTYSVKLLEDITGKPIKYFRAPGFSIRKSEAWAFDVLKECGIDTDSSVFPARHAHGGIPDYGKAIPGIIKHNGIDLKEFPINSRLFFGRNIVFSGGGYFRFLPYKIIQSWTKDSEYLLSYLHPRDFDIDQPVLNGLPLTRKFRSYVGLSKAEDKLLRWLKEFKFTDINTAALTIEWENAPIINL